MTLVEQISDLSDICRHFMYSTSMVAQHPEEGKAYLRVHKARMSPLLPGMRDVHPSDSLLAGCTSALRYTGYGTHM